LAASHGAGRSPAGRYRRAGTWAAAGDGILFGSLDGIQVGGG
jgi:hypothetical protein